MLNTSLSTFRCFGDLQIECASTDIGSIVTLTDTKDPLGTLNDIKIFLPSTDAKRLAAAIEAYSAVAFYNGADIE